MRTPVFDCYVFLWVNCGGMIHVVWTVAVNYLVALCIYAVASLTLAGVRGYRLEVPDLHETPKDVFCVTPSVDARIWVI